MPSDRRRLHMSSNVFRTIASYSVIRQWN